MAGLESTKELKGLGAESTQELKGLDWHEIYQYINKET